jgi:hypothetical protein
MSFWSELTERSSWTTLTGIATAVAKYGSIASAAVQAVQNELGESSTPSVQQTKRNAAVGIVLATAHAGEQVPVSQVQKIATVVDLAASTAKLLGLFGKAPASPEAVIEVPSLPWS